LQKLNAEITNQLLTVPQKEQLKPTSKQPLQMVFLKELVEQFMAAKERQAVYLAQPNFAGISDATNKKSHTGMAWDFSEYSLFNLISDTFILLTQTAKAHSWCLL